MSYGFVFYALGWSSPSRSTAPETPGPQPGSTWLCFWLLEIPLAYVLARVVGLGPFGAFLAITIGYSSLALVSAVLFRRGKWKLRRV